MMMMMMMMMDFKVDYKLRKQGNCLETEIMQGTTPDARRRGRPRTAWMDNIKTWTGLPVEESIRMTEDRDKWRKYVHGVAPQIRSHEFWRYINFACMYVSK